MQSTMLSKLEGDLPSLILLALQQHAFVCSICGRSDSSLRCPNVVWQVTWLEERVPAVMQLVPSPSAPYTWSDRLS